jgi:hypothetical protein
MAIGRHMPHESLQKRVELDDERDFEKGHHDMEKRTRGTNGLVGR